MFTKFHFIVLAFIFSTKVFAGFAVGGHTGFHIPVADNDYYRARLAKSSYLWGGQLRYQFSNAWSAQLAHTRYQFKTSPVSPQVTDVRGLYRVDPDANTSLVFGFGPGVASLSDEGDRLSLRSSIGLDYKIDENLSLNFSVNFVNIFNPSPSRSITLLSPQFGILWSFK